MSASTHPENLTGLDVLLSEQLIPDISRSVEETIAPFFGFFEERRYLLLPVSNIDKVWAKQVVATATGKEVLYLVGVSYSRIMEKMAAGGEISKGAKTIRRALMEDSRGCGFVLDKRAVVFYPETMLAQFTATTSNLRGLICEALADFGGKQMRDGRGVFAYFWYDCLNILENYLAVALTLSRLIRKNLPVIDNEAAYREHVETIRRCREHFNKCQAAMELLPYCVPLGWKDGSISTFVVLCE